MSKYINEEISYIKYLSNYKRGLVISEQDLDDVGIKEPPIQPTPKKPSNQNDVISTGTPTNAQVKETKDLTKEVEELKQQISMLNSMTDKGKTIEQVKTRLVDINKTLQDKCAGKFLPGKVCKELAKEKQILNQQMLKLQGMESDGESQSTPQKIGAWTAAITSVLGLLSSILLMAGVQTNNPENRDM